MTGSTTYELTNHLGNVLTTISDKKVGHSSNGATVDYYRAVVLNQTNYYSGGMQMPVRRSDSLLFTNTFDAGTDGWAVYNVGTLQNDNGRLKFTGTVAWSAPKKALTLEEGRQYRIRFTIDMGNCSDLHVPVYKSDISSYVVMDGVGISITASGSYEGTFTATSNNMLLLIEMIPGVNPPPGSAGYYWIDDVSLEQLGPVDSIGVEYRYAFNGQEKSTEINSSGNLYTAKFWEYDSRIVRRWNVDPKPDISLSPYGVFRGNPILFSDVTGDTIDIRNKNETVQYRQGKIFKYNEDGSLSSEEYSGNNSFILGAQKDLNKIGRTKYGRLYLKDLSESKNRLKIFDSGDPFENNYDETGSHTITYSRVPIYIKIDGVYFDKSFIKLGHELSHAWDWDQGKSDNFMPTKFGGLPKSEINAVRFENYLRAYDKESTMRRIYTYRGVPYQILDGSSPKYYLNFKRPLRRDEIYKPLVTISNSSQTKVFGNVHVIDRMTIGLPQKPPMPQVIYNIKTNNIVKDDE